MKYVLANKQFYDELKSSVEYIFSSSSYNISCVQKREDSVITGLESCTMSVTINVDFRFDIFISNSGPRCELTSVDYYASLDEQYKFMGNLVKLQNRLQDKLFDFTFKGPAITVLDAQWNFLDVVTALYTICSTLLLSEWNVDISVYSLHFLRNNTVILYKDCEVLLDFTYSELSLDNLCIMLIAVMKNYEQ